VSTKSSSGRNRFFDFESSSYVRFVIDPILIAELGVATLVVGGTLAYRTYSQDRSFLQTATGLFSSPVSRAFASPSTVLAACLCSDQLGTLP
jgi:hypothetical protein